MARYKFWQVTGSYYEVCNCEAICPCRRHGEKKGGRSTYGICDFALSWRIAAGHVDELDLSNLSVVLAGSYDDDEVNAPWRVILYVDEMGSAQQRKALADIFLGRAGGETLKNFARAIEEVYAVRTARIELDHSPNQEKLEVEGYTSAVTAKPYAADEPVSCGIPGHDRPGREIIAEYFRIEDEQLRWEVKGRCGFATDFAYSSED